MKSAFIVFVGSVFFSGLAASARADVITGPALPNNVVNQTNSGLEISALTQSYLQGFVYQNQGGADTIELGSVVLNPANGSYGIGPIVGMISVPAGNPSFSASSLNWQMNAGTNYVLVATGSPDNGKYAPYEFPGNPVSDGQISVISGVFSADLVSIAFNSANWGDFNNISTVPANVPEPSSFFLVLVPAAVGFLRWRSKSRKEESRGRGPYSDPGTLQAGTGYAGV